MDRKEEILEMLAHDLTAVSESERRMCLRNNSMLPSTATIERLMELLKAIIFPDFFGQCVHSMEGRLHRVGVELSEVRDLLEREISHGYAFHCACTMGSADEVAVCAQDLTMQFLQQLPEIKRLLLTDVEAIVLRDPVVKNFGEVVFCYPVVQMMIHHRIAHALYRLGVPIIPRIISERAHSLTGIDIHPAAQIGEYFAIDHGTGVVIGATSVIGKHVMLYQGVTLGARNFQRDANGHPMDVPRHPIVEDNVTIYSNSSILGRITIGHDSVIGGNIWITSDVPPHSNITQSTPIKA